MPGQFEDYRLLRLIGEGSMAQVWSARRRTLDGAKPCAVKIIQPCHADDPAYREMFQREARLSLALSGHANVVSVLDVGEHEGRSYLAMELIEGVTLGQLARQLGRPWPVDHAVYVLAGVLRALCHIHGHTVDGEPQGIVHRDVTPHNVMISARGEVKLMDFGIAQRADAEPSLGGALGKLAYVPLEQVEGDPDQRADLYSAGAIAFELLDGRRFRWHCADEDAYFLEIYRNRVPTMSRKDIPAPVNAVLRGLLQPDRQRRIPSAVEALRELEAWSGFREVPTELEAVYSATIEKPRSEKPRSEQPKSERRKSPLPEEISAEGSRRRSSDVPRGRKPWESSSPPAANDSGRFQWRATLPHVGSGSVVEPRVSTTIPTSVWASNPPTALVTDEPPPYATTRALPEADRNPSLAAEPMERLVTGRHPAAPRKQDIPSARASAEIAVTKAQPSRRAPWAVGTDPIVARAMNPEPGAPVQRRRVSAAHSMDEGAESVAPRARESAAVHHAARKPGVVAGEIVTDDGLAILSKPQWGVGSR